jgi:serine/threonine-protein kinase RsbW
LADEIVLRVPASTSHIGLVRAAASALAALLDLTYERITDLHIAVDEACSRVMATADPSPSRMEVIFTVGEAALGVSVSGDAPMKPGATLLNVWSETILRSVTDELEVQEEDGHARLTFRLRRSGPR